MSFTPVNDRFRPTRNPIEPESERIDAVRVERAEEWSRYVKTVLTTDPPTYDTRRGRVTGMEVER
ncbi:hypothetical protein ABZX64_12670 [Streptomyces misionensis]|uniref:hypothetical protein n=1 Tax=Streptomyces misionensis TaxID=67331 RepID=UPI0033ADADAD